MTKKIFIIPALALVGMTAVAGQTALAYGWNGQGKNMGNNQKREHREEISQTIESNDYAAFKDLIKGTRMADIVDTQYKFERLVEAHNLRNQGRLEEAREIMKDIGFIRGPTNKPFCQK